jgi:hypothetical protein
MALLSMIFSIFIIVLSLDSSSAVLFWKAHRPGNKKDRNLLTLSKQCEEAIFMLV